jgi:hypothetical protein
VSDPRAPRVFWTRRGGNRWAVEHNPWPPGTIAFFEWLRDYWRDQAERGFRRAKRSETVAIVFLGIAVVSVVLRVFGVLG